jgi:hypothetical protein
MRSLAIAAAAWGFAATTAIAPAAPVEERNVLAGKVKLQADQGYVYLQGANRFFGVFLRAPDEATRAEYQQDRDKAFADARKRYQNQLRRWEADVRLATQTRKKPPEKPEELTLENFTFAPIELRDSFFFGPMFIYAKSEAGFSYLNAVKPGTYIWYGAMVLAPEGGAFGTCACMGTISFEVKPGVVTDLGNFLAAAPEPGKAHDFAVFSAWQRAEEKAAKSGKPVENPLFRPALAFGLPDSLKGWGSVQAEFHASGKLNNYYGVPITRLPPIAGVLGYRRDTVIDLRTNTDVPNPRIVTQARIKK